MPKYRNPKIGALAPIRVVNEVLATGDGAHGVRTAAFNLPNDERIVQDDGIEARDAEERPGGEVFEDSGADRDARAVARGSEAI